MADLISQLNELAGKGPGAVSEEERLPLMGALVKLRDTLENPIEKFMRIFFVRQAFICLSVRTV